MLTKNDFCTIFSNFLYINFIACIDYVWDYRALLYFCIYIL
nr:MAG TPA: hypothetical protein [Caudoviricetes sp.]